MTAISFPPDFPGAKVIGTDHSWVTTHPRKYVIVHGTADGSPATQIAAWFQVNSPATSTHYIIDRDGTIVQCVPESRAAWGNGVLSTGHAPFWSDSVNPNLITLSIEHVKPSANNADLLTDAQKQASFKLIAHLCQKWQIPLQMADATGGITGHFSIDPVNRSNCPGPYPWQDLIRFLTQGPTMRWLRNGHTACLSEFEGYNGDCTQTAHLSAYHCIDPIRWPMTAAILNTLVAHDIAQGWAGTSGSQSDTGLANSLTFDKIPFRQLYAANDWAGALNSLGGISPIIIQVSDAGHGHLPGDEWGVLGHAIQCVAWDPKNQQGYFCDGDHPNASQPVLYTLAQLKAAQPFCVTILDYTIPETATVTVDTTGLGPGFADYATSHNVQGAVKIKETGIPNGGTGAVYAVLGDNTLLIYTPGTGVTAIQGLGAVLTATPPPAPAPTPVILDPKLAAVAQAESALQDATDTLKTVEANLAAAVASWHAAQAGH